MPEISLRNDGYVLETLDRHAWYRIINNQGNSARFSNRYVIPEYAKKLHLKVEYNAAAGTTNLVVLTSCYGGAYASLMTYTPANSGDNTSTEGGATWYHGLMEFTDTRYLFVPTDGFREFMLYTSGHTNGVSVWVKFV
jgi:hypothetical protein